MKTIANLTKKGYRAMCDYISANNSPEETVLIIEAMTNAMKNALEFDPEMKTPKEVCEKRVAHRHEILQRENTTQYEKYHKARFERLKETYPGVSTTILKSKPLHVIKASV